MNKSRRNFLKIAGITAVGIASEKYINAGTQNTATRLTKVVNSTKKLTKTKVVQRRKISNGCRFKKMHISKRLQQMY